MLNKKKENSGNRNGVLLESHQKSKVTNYEIRSRMDVKNTIRYIKRITWYGYVNRAKINKEVQNRDDLGETKLTKL